MRRLCTESSCGYPGRSALPAVHVATEVEPRGKPERAAIHMMGTFQPQRKRPLRTRMPGVVEAGGRTHRLCDYVTLWYYTNAKTRKPPNVIANNPPTRPYGLNKENAQYIKLIKCRRPMTLKVTALVGRATRGVASYRPPHVTVRLYYCWNDHAEACRILGVAHLEHC